MMSPCTSPPLLGMLLLASIAGAVAAPAPPSAARPRLSWASHPTMPNETALVWGSRLDLASGGFAITLLSSLASPFSPPDAAGSRRNTKGASGGQHAAAAAAMIVTPFDVSRTSAKLILPATLPAGVYRICPVVAGVPGNTNVDGNATTADCVLCNAPDVFWRRGDVNLTHATVGGWVRVFGRLGDDFGRLARPALTLMPTAGGGGLASDMLLLAATNGTANDALYLLPPTVGPGRYTLGLRVGGLTLALAPPDDTMTVAPAALWPMAGHVHRVNSTADLFAALNAMRDQGGGEIELQRGTYLFTTETIDLPPWTVLRGVSTAHVALVWRTDGLSTAAVPKYLVGGNATFAVEDLSISCTRFYNDVIADGALPGVGRSQYVRIRRVRIRTDCFFRLTERGAAARRGLSANFTYEQVCLPVCAFVRVYVCVCLFMCVNISVCLFMCAAISVYVCVFVCVYVYVRVRAYYVERVRVYLCNMCV